MSRDSDLIVVLLLIVGLIAFGFLIHGSIRLTAPVTAEAVCAQHPGWSQETCQRVENHEIWIGMTTEMAEASLVSLFGVLHRTHRTVTRYSVSEQWVYEELAVDGYWRPTRYLYFDNGVLTGWQE